MSQPEDPGRDDRHCASGCKAGRVADLLSGGRCISGFYGVAQRGWNVGPSSAGGSAVSVPHGIGAATGFRVVFEYPSGNTIPFEVVNTPVIQHSAEAARRLHSR